MIEFNPGFDFYPVDYFSNGSISPFHLVAYSARDYAVAMKLLLPIGLAWQWSDGGFGDGLVLSTAYELERIQQSAYAVMDEAIELHRPKAVSYHIRDYRRVANDAIVVMPRKPAAIGCTVGYRLWSQDAPTAVSACPVLRVEHLLQPAAIGSRIGTCLWSASSRYYLRVRFDKSLISSVDLATTLLAFKQAHVYLFFEDVPQIGGNV